MRRLPKHISVTKFDQYQHGGEKAKDLPWLKLHVNTLTDLELMALKPSSFKVWICVLLLARRSANRVPTEVKTLSNLTHLSAVEVDKGLRDLLGIGLLEPIRVERKSRPKLEEVGPKQRQEDSSSRGKGRTQYEDDLPYEKEQEAAKLRAFAGSDEKAAARTINTLAAQLPVGALAKVCESVSSRNGAVGPGYVINALKSELEERVA